MSEIAALGALGAYSAACIDAREMLVIPGAMLDIMDRANGLFTSLGEVALDTDDCPVYIGLKKRGLTDVFSRVGREMLLGDTLLAHDSSAASALPLFTLAVAVTVGAENRGIGILTEDFTKRGNLELEEIYRRFKPGMAYKEEEIAPGLERMVFDALGKSPAAGAFGRMLARVQDQEVLIDFDDLQYPTRDDIEPYVQLATELAIVIES